MDALTAVLDDGGRADGRDRIDDLSLDRMGRHIRGVYTEVLDRRGRREPTN